MRLDRWFRAHHPEVKYGALQKLLRSGQIRLDGKRVKAGDRIAEGQTVRVPPLAVTAAGSGTGPKSLSKDERDTIRAMVIYRDDHVIAINKPPGVPVQGGTKSTRHIDGMLDALQFDAPERPRLVHRLDKDTSGVLLLARTRKAAQALTRSFAHRDTQKTYWALVVGTPRPAEGIMSGALAKQGAPGQQRVKVTSVEDDDAKTAATEYVTVDEAAPRFAWLALRPITGRTHQLRVHATALGHPIVGDPKYGGERARATGEIENRLHLHARRLRIRHPHSGTLDIEADLPQHMRESWAFLNFDPNTPADHFDEPAQ